MLNMLDDLLSTFQSTFNPFTATVVDPVLYCLIRASRDVHSSMVVHEGEDEAAEGRTMKLSLLKTIRQRSLHILARLGLRIYP
jgi:U3 small nucleolar RNA-associated protein 20